MGRVTLLGGGGSGLVVQVCGREGCVGHVQERDSATYTSSLRPHTLVA